MSQHLWNWSSDHIRGELQSYSPLIDPYSVTPTPTHMAFLSLFNRTPIAGSYDTMTALVFHESDTNRKLSYDRARNVSIGFNLEQSFVSSYPSQQSVDACELLEWIDCQVHKKIYG